MRTRLMYDAACKVEFQSFNRSHSQLTFFNFYKNNLYVFVGKLLILDIQVGHAWHYTCYVQQYKGTQMVIV